MNPQRRRLLVLLVVLFASLYMITYSGRVESGDSLSLMDAAGSLVQFGDDYLQSKTNRIHFKRPTLSVRP
jgi:hypothetical protein